MWCHAAKTKTSGFTLIELMIVVAVIAILAAIAYPLYTEQVRKAGRTEGREALLAIAQAEERRYTAEGSYTTSFSDLSVGSVCDVSNNTCTTKEKGYYTITLSGGGSTFTATASPQKMLASDTCTSMTINQLGERGGSGTGCWD
ncbi:MAG: prepilin-type N-terminal cleavage/methylation domain-containing protein [Gammaproteobacteria bacterium]|nr:MAG: prepilin-type N-terminal cleavage/methylation domain-containing protein [Gammaproteobacteria bacterium]